MSAHLWRNGDSCLEDEQPGPSGLSHNINRDREPSRMFHHGLMYQEAETSRDTVFSLESYSSQESEDDYEGDNEEEEEEEDQETDDEREDDSEDSDEDHGLSDDGEIGGYHSERSLSPWRTAEFIPRDGVQSIAQQLRETRRRDEEKESETDSDDEEPPRRRRRTDSSEENRLYEAMPHPNGVIDVPDSLRGALNGIPVALDLARVLMPFSKEL